MRPITGVGDLALGALTTGSTAGTWTQLPQAFARHTIRGLFSSGTSGTVQLRGALSSDSTTVGILVLATIDNTTQIGYATTAIPVSWLQALATAISTGGNPSTITLTYAGTA